MLIPEMFYRVTQKSHTTRYVHTFFQIGTVALSVSMQYLTASRESFLCGDEIPIITLASVIGTTLWTEQGKNKNNL